MRTWDLVLVHIKALGWIHLSAYLSPHRLSLPLQSDTSLCIFTLYHRNVKPVVDRAPFLERGRILVGYILEQKFEENILGKQWID